MIYNFPSFTTKTILCIALFSTFLFSKRSLASHSTHLTTNAQLLSINYEECKQRALSIKNSVLSESTSQEGGGILYVYGKRGTSKATIRCIQMSEGTAITITAHSCTAVCQTSGCESGSIVQSLSSYMYE